MITLVISIVIFVQTNILTIMIFQLKDSTIEKETVKIEEQLEKFAKEEVTQEWKLIIPKIQIEAVIKEGTDGETINNYVGHFEETPTETGNIGLIAASAGYKENYFANLKEITQGDVIIYVCGNIRREYKVINHTIIHQTDWSYLSKTEDNRITLITGILEEPEKRRCVQAIEIN